MSGVTPDSTTAQMAGNVPKETNSAVNGGPGAATIQSAHPDSTTAQLAKDVPLESKKQDGNPSAGGAPLENTPSKTSTAQDVPAVVRDSIERSRSEPEAAASESAVEEKKEVERELLHEVPPQNSGGTPPPTETIKNTDTAPAATGATGATPEAPRSGEISPKTKPGEPKVTTGPETTTTNKESGPGTQPEEQQPAQKQSEQKDTEQSGGQTQESDTKQDQSKSEGDKGKKKSRMSGVFSKLKEKLK